MKLIQVKMNNQLHKQFKQKCLEKEVSMSDKIREWVEKWVNKRD